MDPLWILLGLVAVLSSIEGSETSGSRSARFFHTHNYEVFEVKPSIKYNFCVDAQKTPGACLSADVCALEGGRSIGYCKDGNVCCNVVKKSCNEVTTSHFVQYQTPSFPKNETVGSACVLKLQIQRNICALRMDLEVFEMTPFKKDFCPHDSFSVIGTKNLTSNLCGNLTSMMSTFEVEHLSVITVGSFNQGVQPYRFSIRFTMIPCQSIVSVRSPINSGMKNKDALPYIPPTTTAAPTTKQTTTTTSTPPALRDEDGEKISTPLPVGKIVTKPPPPKVITGGEVEENVIEDLDYEPPSPESIFKDIFESRIRVLNQGRRKGSIPRPENVIPGGLEKCYLYDPETGQYRVNERCPIAEKTYATYGWRVIGGKMANLNEYPWQAALVYKKSFFCGGSLITDRLVVTASHCIFGGFKSGIDRLQVILGDHDLSTKNESSSVTRNISRVIWNLHYNTLNTENDIALIQMDKPVSFSPTILPISLPSDLRETYENRNVTVVGWGRHNLKSRKMSPILKEFTAPVDYVDHCTKKWSKYPRISAIKEMHICMNITYGTPCHGDSGGPLITCGSEDHCTLVGLVSFGFPLCKNVGLPAVFTRITSFMRWIEINASPIYFDQV